MTAPKSSSRTLEIPRRAATFAAAAFALMAGFFGSAIAIPMMAVWKPALAMTTGDVAMTVVSYFGGCILTLLFFARLSNFFGRKPVVVAVLILGAAACWIFASAESTAALDAGRFLQGLSCGFASSAAMSWAPNCSSLPATAETSLCWQCVWPENRLCFDREFFPCLPFPSCSVFASWDSRCPGQRERPPLGPVGPGGGRLGVWDWIQEPDGPSEGGAAVLSRERGSVFPR